MNTWTSVTGQKEESQEHREKGRPQAIWACQFGAMTRNASRFNPGHWFPNILWPVPGDLVSSLPERGWDGSTQLIWVNGQEGAKQLEDLHSAPYWQAAGQGTQRCEQWDKNGRRTSSELPRRAWHAPARTLRQERARRAAVRLTKLRCSTPGLNSGWD